jgi:2-oxo-4-hydroxy-4-carboxy-5-ureidoimidazoline decarboxylase
LYRITAVNTIQQTSTSFLQRSNVQGFISNDRIETSNDMSDSKPTVTDLLSQSKESVISILGGIYEHSSWIAEKFYSDFIDNKEAAINITDVSTLFQAMSSIVDDATESQKMTLLRAHPDLCEKIDKLKTLTKSSQEEQQSAGLHTLTDEERDKFHSLNRQYKEKFGFPFILAARNASKYTVLSAIEGRIHLPVEVEFTGALQQVQKIAWMRLLAAFNITNQKGFLTCHVLDTAHGRPGKITI